MYDRVDQWIKDRWGWFKALPWYHKLWGWLVIIAIFAAFILLAFIFAGNPERTMEEKKDETVADMVEGRIEANKERDKELEKELEEKTQERAEADARIATTNEEYETRRERIINADTFKEIRDAVNEEGEDR